MARKGRFMLAATLILLASIIAWGTVYHEAKRTTRSVRIVHKQKGVKNTATVKKAAWKQASIPKKVDSDLDKSLDKRLADIHFVGSALIVRNGEVVFERQYGQENAALKRNTTSDTAYAICSIQKLFTGALVMQQVQRGKMSLSDHLSKFYPSIPHANDITIRQMLDMTSGLKMDGPVGPTKLQSDAQIVDYDVQHVTFDKNYHDNWLYAQVNYNILTGILKKVTGKDYTSLFNEQIVDRFKLHQTTMMPSNNCHVAVAYGVDDKHEIDYKKAVVTPDAFWHDEIGTGRVATSARDLYKMISGIMQGKLISKASLDALYESGSRSTYGGGTYNLYGGVVNHGLGYGYQGMSCVSKDGKDAVILLSNTYRQEYTVKPFSQQLYLELFKDQIK